MHSFAYPGKPDSHQVSLPRRVGVEEDHGTAAPPQAKASASGACDRKPGQTKADASAYARRHLSR